MLRGKKKGGERRGGFRRHQEVKKHGYQNPIHILGSYDPAIQANLCHVSWVYFMKLVGLFLDLNLNCRIMYDLDPTYK